MRRMPIKLKTSSYSRNFSIVDQVLSFPKSLMQ
jgi:hypothetical protein